MEFLREKLKHNDTNFVFHLWIKSLKKIQGSDDKENRKFEVIKLDSHEIFINHANKTAFYTRIGHHSSVCTNSRNHHNSKNRGIFNLKPAKKEFDPLGISTSAANGSKAAYLFLLKKQYVGYRMCVILRNDFHTCAVFIKRDIRKYWHIYLFNTLDARFSKFEDFISGFPSKQIRGMYTKAGAQEEERCDVYSFEELKRFFMGCSRTYPFNRNDVFEYVR